MSVNVNWVPHVPEEARMLSDEVGEPTPQINIS